MPHRGWTTPVNSSTDEEGLVNQHTPQVKHFPQTEGLHHHRELIHGRVVKEDDKVIIVVKVSIGVISWYALLELCALAKPPHAQVTQSVDTVPAASIQFIIAGHGGLCAEFHYHQWLRQQGSDSRFREGAVEVLAHQEDAVGAHVVNDGRTSIAI